MPAFTKTWEYVLNEVVGAGSDLDDRNQRLMLRMHEALTDQLDTRDQGRSAIAMTSPLTVVASSDSTTASAADNWGVQADIVFANAGSAHSWMHYQVTDFFGAADHLYILIDCIPTDATDDAMIYMAFSRDGWNSDGTTTNRPTAASSDVLVVRDGTTTSGNFRTSDAWAGNDGANAQAVLNLAIADDASALKCTICIGGVVAAHWGFWHDVNDPTRPAASDPYTCYYWSLDITTEMMLSTTIDAVAAFLTLDPTGLPDDVYLVTYRFNNGTAEMVDENTSAYDTTRVPLPVFVGGDVPRGVLDAVPDFWFGCVDDATGDPTPATGTTNTVNVGDFIMPYADNATMQTS